MAADEVAFDPAGRWGGRLTSRDLPDDPTVEALPAADRAELATHWLQRGASELRVGESFAVIRDALAEHASDHLAALAARAVDDEARHAQLSRVVASRYAGVELAPLPRLPHSVPAHASAPPALRRSLWVVGQCCLNETIATAVLEASFAATRAPLARAALRELLADEVDHARIGWAHLAELDAGVRDSLGPWLLPLTRANVRMWRTTPRDYPSRPELVEHGALTRELLEGAIQAALRDLVIPGFTRLELQTEPLRRWADAGTPTEQETP